MEIPTPRTIVAPRAYPPETADSLPLCSLILDLEESEYKTIRLVGRGKTTALTHLADELRDYPQIRILDDEQVSFSDLPNPDLPNLTIFASRCDFKADLELQLSSWTQDEVIEYLIAKSPMHCKSVMSRLTESGDLWLSDGSPEVLPPVLDLMIDNDQINSVEQAILNRFWSLNISLELKERLVTICMKHLFSNEDCGIELTQLSPELIGENNIRFLTTQTVRYVLACYRILEKFREGEAPEVMNSIWPQSLIDMLATRIAKDEMVCDFLDQLVAESDSRKASNAASLLLKKDTNWKPLGDKRLYLNDAKLTYARWPEVSLEIASLINTDLAMSNLRKANFRRALMTKANLYKSFLSGANLDRCNAWRSDFSEATMRAVSAESASFNHSNFEHAVLECSNFTRSSFVGTNLQSADLSNCSLTEAKFMDADVANADFSKSRMRESVLSKLDLRSVNLSETDLCGAIMKRCKMQEMELERGLFRCTLFNGALLTGTRFRNCDMRHCILSNAKMADIDWEDCDLRGADFFNCFFQMGSTRAGTVDSPYPSHGTRTGYYTDDFDDHYFKSPEETRKANLCGCNLLEAKVFDADFYLVDLRGAKYDDEQKAHFQKCGALLDD